MKKIDFNRHIKSDKLESFKTLENKLVYNHDETLFLQGLTRCRKEAISDTISAIILPSPIPALIKAGEKNAHILYERVNYQHLLSTLTYKAIIVGTPYSGKTSFLYYFLVRLVSTNIKSCIFDPLPSTCPGGTQRLEVVIYRKGSDLTLYFLDELKAYTYTIDSFVDKHGHCLINSFLPTTTLCLIDYKDFISTRDQTYKIKACMDVTYPVIVTAESHRVNTTSIRNYFKNGKYQTFIHSLWSFKDLLSLYKYTRVHEQVYLNNTTTSEGHNYDRFIYKGLLILVYSYGNTLKCIQHSASSELNAVQGQMSALINSIDFIQFWDLTTGYYLRMAAFTHTYLLHLMLERDGNKVRCRIKPMIRPASSLVSNLICKTYMSRYSQDELVSSIQTMTNSPNAWNLKYFSILLQLYVSRQISTAGGTVGWTVRANHQSVSDLKPFNLHMRVERGFMPAFSDMLVHVLYVSELGWRHFLVYKCMNSGTGTYELNLIRADLTAHPVALIDIGAIGQIYAWLKLDISTSDVKCNYYLCPLRDAHSCVVSTSSAEALPSFYGSVSIIHLPPLFETVSASTASDATASIASTVPTHNAPLATPIADPASSNTSDALTQPSTSQQSG